MSFKPLFDTLLNNLVESVDYIKAAVITLRDGLIISSIVQDESTRDEVIGATTAVFDNFLKRIQHDFGSAKEVINVMTVDQNKFSFCGAGPKIILTILADLNANDNALKVYSQYIAEQIKLVMEEKKIETHIPHLIDSLANMRSGALPQGKFDSKIIILGENEVGKSTLIYRYCTGNFKENYNTTLNLDIITNEMHLSDNCIVNLSIWDIAGQKNKKLSFRKHLYDEADIALVQFDVSRKETFDSIDYWINDLHKNVRKMIPIILIGNKMDLEKRLVNEKEIETKAKKIDCPYILSSAKNGVNVDEIFQFAAFKFCESL